jgi:hypothetical protein
MRGRCWFLAVETPNNTAGARARLPCYPSFRAQEPQPQVVADAHSWPSHRQMSRFGMIATTVIGGVIIAAAGATILAVLTRAILNGQGIAIAVLVIGFAAPAIWDRWRCRRWPQPTELPRPRVQTAQVEIVER